MSQRIRRQRGRLRTDSEQGLPELRVQPELTYKILVVGGASANDGTPPASSSDVAQDELTMTAIELTMPGDDDDGPAAAAHDDDDMPALIDVDSGAAAAQDDNEVNEDVDSGADVSGQGHKSSKYDWWHFPLAGICPRRSRRNRLRGREPPFPCHTSCIPLCMSWEPRRCIYRHRN